MVFDWVRKRPDNQFIYNTYFFRSTQYWMYENHAHRTRYGDPLYIAREWEGVPSDVDGYAHVWYFNGSSIVNDALFFKGNYVGIVINNNNNTSLFFVVIYYLCYQGLFG